MALPLSAGSLLANNGVRDGIQKSVDNQGGFIDFCKSSWRTSIEDTTEVSLCNACRTLYNHVCHAAVRPTDLLTTLQLGAEYRNVASKAD